MRLLASSSASAAHSSHSAHGSGMVSATGVSRCLLLCSCVAPFVPQQERAGCLPGAPQVRPTGLPSRFVRARALLGQVDKLNGFLCHEGGRLAQEFFCLEHLVRGRPSGVLGCPSPSCPLVTRGGGSQAVAGLLRGRFSRRVPSLAFSPLEQVLQVGRPPCQVTVEVLEVFMGVVLVMFSDRHHSHCVV